ADKRAASSALLGPLVAAGADESELDVAAVVVWCFVLARPASLDATKATTATPAIKYDFPCMKPLFEMFRERECR
ncbi:MAG: hypothetical protein ACXWLQ_11315, partial [Rhizomicrobium sp.]